MPTAVADWVFEKAAGIYHKEEAAGFCELIYEPHPDKRIGFLRAELETRHGTIRAAWFYEGEAVRYELETAVPTTVMLGETKSTVAPGKYTFRQSPK